MTVGGGSGSEIPIRNLFSRLILLGLKHFCATKEDRWERDPYPELKDDQGENVRTLFISILNESLFQGRSVPLFYKWDRPYKSVTWRTERVLMMPTTLNFL